MSTECQFGAWLDKWLVDNPEWTAQRLARTLGASEAAVSAWRNCVNSPDARFILGLANITDEDHAYLAHLAYGWPMEESTDPLMREPLLREAGQLLGQLVKMAPGLIPAAVEVLRGLLRAAKKEKH